MKFSSSRLFRALIFLALALCAAPIFAYPPQPSIVPSGGNQYTVSWEAAYSDGFNLESSTDLKNWTAVATAPTIIGTKKQVVVTGTGRQTFFRLTTLLAASPLTAADVQTIINQAVTRAVHISPNSVIAVTDREGNVLAVWVVRSGAAGDDEIATAVSKAGTAAYLSSNQNAFTSRTAGFIIQQHFPPGVSNSAPGPLVGVGLSNLFVSDINKFRKPGSLIVFNSSPGLTINPVFGSSLDGSPGGVPLYKNGILVGAIGVTGDGVPDPVVFRSQNPFTFIPDYDVDEEIALAGQFGFRPADAIKADNVYINGIALPYV